MTIFDPTPHIAPPPPVPGAAQLIDANGGRHGALIVAEAERAGLSLSLACALVEQESSFRNVFGHDGVRNPIPKGGAAA